MYRVEFDRRAQKELAKLPHIVQGRVVAAIDSLAEEPRPAGCRSVKDAPGGTYRVRVGDYRIIYIVLDDEQVIIVSRVGKRDESTYQRL